MGFILDAFGTILNYVVGSVIGTLIVYTVMMEKFPQAVKDLNPGQNPIVAMIEKARSDMGQIERDINMISVADEPVQKPVKKEKTLESLDSVSKKMRQLETENMLLSGKLAGAHTEIEYLKKSCQQ